MIIICPSLQTFYSQVILDFLVVLKLWVSGLPLFSAVVASANVNAMERTLLSLRLLLIRERPFYSPSRVTSTLAQWGTFYAQFSPLSHSLPRCLDRTKLGIPDTLLLTLHTYFGEHYLSPSSPAHLRYFRQIVEKSLRGQVRLPRTISVTRCGDGRGLWLFQE